MLSFSSPAFIVIGVAEAGAAERTIVRVIHLIVEAKTPTFKPSPNSQAPPNHLYPPLDLAHFFFPIASGWFSFAEMVQAVSRKSFPIARRERLPRQLAAVRRE